MNPHNTTTPTTFPRNPRSTSDFSNNQLEQQTLHSQGRAPKRQSELSKITQLTSNVSVFEAPSSKRVRTHSFFPSHIHIEQNYLLSQSNNNLLCNGNGNNQTHHVTPLNEREYYHTEIPHPHSDWIAKDFAEMLQFWEVNERNGAFETIREKLNGISQKVHTLDTRLCNVVKLVDLNSQAKQYYTTSITTHTHTNTDTNQMVANHPVLIPSRTTNNALTEQHNPFNSKSNDHKKDTNNTPQTPTKFSSKKVPISPPPFVIPTLPLKRPHPLDLDSKISCHSDKQFRITQFPYILTPQSTNKSNTNTNNAITPISSSTLPLSPSTHPLQKSPSKANNATTHANNNNISNNNNNSNHNNVRYNIDKNVPSPSSFSNSNANNSNSYSNKHPVYKHQPASIMLIIPPSPSSPSTPLPKLEATNPISLSSMNEKILCSHLPFILLNVADSEFNAFIDFWLKVPVFSWSLIYSSLIAQRNVETDIIGEDEFTFLPKHIVIQGICVCWSKEIVYYISLKNQSPSKKGTETLPLSAPQISERFRSLKNVFEQNDTAKILFLMKPQIKLLLSKEIFVKGYILDPMIGAWLIDPDFHKEKTIEQLVDHFAPTALRAPRSIATSNDFERGCVKTFYSFMLMPLIMNAMQSTPRVRSIFLNLEMPVIPILAEMEFCGIGYEASVVYKQKEAISLKLKSLERKAHSLAGGEFSLTSLSEVSDILFNTLKLPAPPPKNGKTSRARKHHCVNAEVLESLASKHPLPLVILEHRKLSHLMSNYVDTLESFCFYDDRFKMKRIYSTILQTAAPTGRLAMNYPNLQAITHEVEFLATSQSSGEMSEGESPDYEIYKENNNANHLKSDPNVESSSSKKAMVNVSVRSAFLVSCGHVLLAADYCQIEFRILAHLCRDEILLNFLSQRTDVFKLLAAHLRNKPLSMITDYDRATTKHVVYGVLYGMGPRALGERLGVSKSEGARRLAEFKSMFSGVGDYLEKVLVECKKNGFVETIYGRRRYLPNIYSTDFKESSKAERQVLNTICQGSAADIVKRAMIVIVDRLKKVNSRTHLLLQLHDELLFEVPIQHLAAVKILVKQTMEQVANLAVPLPVRISTGPNWGEMSPAD